MILKTLLNILEQMVSTLAWRSARRTVKRTPTVPITPMQYHLVTATSKEKMGWSMDLLSVPISYLARKTAKNNLLYEETELNKSVQ